MKRSPSPVPELMLATAVLLSGLGLLGWSWTSFAPPSDLPGDIQPRVAAPSVKPLVEERPYISRNPEPLWRDDESGPWMMVFRKQDVLPPVDLAPPLPALPLPPTPLTVPGPRIEHTRDLPRWGSYPGQEVQND